MENDILVFSGNANRPLSEKICEFLGMPLSSAYVGSFSDGETRVEIQANVRGRDVFIIQPICHPADHHLMESLIIIDACRRASAKRITIVVPYYGYARQERKSTPRTPITAKLVADCYTVAGIDRMLAVELHTSAIQGFFNLPVDHLFSKPIFVPYFENTDNLIVVSPDAGGVQRARAMAKYFNCGLAIVDKRRDQPNESDVMNVIGDVKNKNCLLIDDICDTAGTLCNAAKSCFEKGAASVSAAVTHAVLSGNAVEKIQNSSLKELVVTDSIPLTEKAIFCKKIKQLTLANLLGEAIRRIHRADSISSLFV
ncbi:MAG: ribose-phosphate pyrophosphokinase [Oligoflexales bacterium]|nr:ribose-phosphate pyrophosphokinase [Oligoflexales bacterium]